MNSFIDIVVRATWQWATALWAFTLCVRGASAAPESLSALVTRATGPLATVVESYVTETPGGSTPVIELVAVGHGAAGRVEVARATLPGRIRREPSPHRVERVAGESAVWEACWRVVDHGRPGGSIGCLRRRVRGNNHPDLRFSPEGVLRFPWRFDVSTQRFLCEQDTIEPVPVPHGMPLQRSWSGRAFYLPLPLQRTTPAVVKRALRARGADISPTSESAEVLILPDRADVCAFDRASSPSAILPALRRRVPVVWERELEGVLRELTPP